MAINFVNASFANPGTVTSATTAAQNVTTGNFLIVFVGWREVSTVSISSVSDTAGNTFIPLTQQNSSTFAAGRLYYAYNVTGNASNQITVSFSGSAISPRVYCAQYSGLDTASTVYDEEANTSGNSTSLTTGTVSIPDNGLYFTGLFCRDDRAPTFDAAFTQRGDISSITIADRIVTTGVSDESSVSWTTIAYSVLCSAVFKVAGGGPSVPDAPSDVTNSSVTRTSMTVSWTDNSTDETSFEVEYAPSPYSSWTALSGSPTAANDTSEATGNVLTEGTSYKTRVRATNGSGSSDWAESAVTTTLTRKLKCLVHPDAASVSSVSGVVFEDPTGSDIVGAKIGEFTSASFSGTLESGQAVLKVSCASFGGTSLTTSDTPKVYLQTTTYSSPIFDATVIDEI